MMNDRNCSTCGSDEMVFWYGVSEVCVACPDDDGSHSDPRPGGLLIAFQCDECGEVFVGVEAVSREYTPVCVQRVECSDPYSASFSRRELCKRCAAKALAGVPATALVRP